VTYFTTILPLYLHPENGRITSRNMLAKILYKIHNRIKVNLLVVYTFYEVMSGKFHVPGICSLLWEIRTATSPNRLIVLMYFSINLLFWFIY